MTRSSRLVSALLLPALAGCVVTTFEGPAAPPRVAVAPPPASRAPATPNVSMTPDAPLPSASESPDAVLVAHLVVMHAESRRAPAGIQRSRAQALERASEAHARALAGEPFPELVELYSDEPGAAARGGRLPRFQRGDMVREFSDAAFALGPGELSAVVESPFGYHVILRLE